MRKALNELTGRVADRAKLQDENTAGERATGGPRRAGLYAVAGVAVVAVVAMTLARQAPDAPAGEVSNPAPAIPQEAAPAPAGPEKQVALAQAILDAPAAGPRVAEPATDRVKSEPVAVTEEPTDEPLAALPAGSERFALSAEPELQPNAEIASAEPGPVEPEPAEPARFGLDASNTGSIALRSAPAEAAPEAAQSADPIAGSVEVAETEGDVVEMEQKLASEGAENFEVAAAPAEPARPQRDLTESQTAKWVNLRAGPDNDAAVLAVVPANASIMAQANCRHWCAVVYEGRQGYIYKSFIRRGGATIEG